MTAPALWNQIQDEIKRQMATELARVYKAGAASGGLRKLRLDPASTDDSGELYALLKGLPKIAAGDDVAVITLGGKRFIIGPVQNSTQTEITYDLPIVGEQGFNSPMFSRFSQNSADVSSSTDTSNPVTNFDWTWNLGSGAWTVWAMTFQHCSHSTAGNLVRCQTVVDGSASATALTVGMPVSAQRGLISSESQKTGCTGTITIAAQYRPNTSGTASAGGGTGFALAFRTS